MNDLETQNLEGGDGPEDEELTRIVDQHVMKLFEHCDSVRIFVTRKNPKDRDLTQGLSRGQGNYYAQVGIIDHWLKEQDQNIARDDE